MFGAALASSPETTDGNMFITAFNSTAVIPRRAKDMRCLYYCSTPFQVLNALNMHYNKILAPSADDVEDFKGVMVIVDVFSSARRLAKKIKQEGLFEKVFLIDEEDHKSHNNKVKKAFGIARDTFFPERLLRQQFRRKSAAFLRNRFDCIVSSTFSHPVAALCTVNPDAKYVMMDDGLASYFGNWTKRLRSGPYLAMLKARNHGKDVSDLEALYVMRTELCHTELTDNILQLPDFSQGFLETAFRIFEIPDDIPAYSQKVVWLGHVSGNPEKKAGTVKMTEVFKKYKDDVIARIHPREKELELYEGLATDTDGYMWELQLSKTSMEGRLLVTLGSTGVFTPKLLYNSEPRLLFMYKLIPLPNGSALDEFLQIVSQLKESYAHPEHIYEPGTWEEFEKFIQEYLDETSPSTPE